MYVYVEEIPAGEAFRTVSGHVYVVSCHETAKVKVVRLSDGRTRVLPCGRAVEPLSPRACPRAIPGANQPGLRSPGSGG